MIIIGMGGLWDFAAIGVLVYALIGCGTIGFLGLIIFIISYGMRADARRKRPIDDETIYR